MTAGGGVPGDGLPDSIRLWIIRHGQTEWSLDGRHTGRTDIPLTDEGEREARALAPMLAGVEPVRVLSSPRQRALRTAELAGLGVDEVTDELAEWDYGDYEGLTSPQIHRTDPGWTIFTGVTPGGETGAQVGARADAVLARVRPWLPDGPVVLLSHGHFSRVLAARWIGLDAAAGAHFELGTAAPSILGAEHGVPGIRRWNLPNPRTAP